MPVFCSKNTFFLSSMELQIGAIEVLLSFLFIWAQKNPFNFSFEAIIREDECCTASDTSCELLILLGFKRSASAVVGIATQGQVVTSAL